jgi:hypothetical protein
MTRRKKRMKNSHRTESFFRHSTAARQNRNQTDIQNHAEAVTSCWFLHDSVLTSFCRFCCV